MKKKLVYTSNILAVAILVNGQGIKDEKVVHPSFTRAKKVRNAYLERSSSCEMDVRVRKYFRKEEDRYTG
ncbi:MAG: hypothetical protein ACYDGO_07200 [Smithellaceae bacterium]